jgi:hypothetical protein
MLERLHQTARSITQSTVVQLGWVELYAACVKAIPWFGLRNNTARIKTWRACSTARMLTLHSFVHDENWAVFDRDSLFGSNILMVSILLYYAAGHHHFRGMQFSSQSDQCYRIWSKRLQSIIYNASTRAVPPVPATMGEYVSLRWRQCLKRLCTSCWRKRRTYIGNYTAIQILGHNQNADSISNWSKTGAQFCFLAEPLALILSNAAKAFAIVRTLLTSRTI